MDFSSVIAEATFIVTWQMGTEKRVNLEVQLLGRVKTIQPKINSAGLPILPRMVVKQDAP